MPRTILNLLVVWLLTGIWHGSTWNFLLWGLLIFLLIALEKLGLGPFLERHRRVARVYMLLAIPLTWLLFAVPDVGQIGIYLTRPVPLLWRWHCGKPGGLPSLWEAVWSLSGSGLSPLQSLAGADLGPDPVFCSGNGGVPVAVLGGSLLHVRFRE